METVSNFIFVPDNIYKVEWNILRDGHRLLEILQSVWKSCGQFKQPLRLWLHPFLLLQCCWKHRVPHATAYVQGTFVVYFNKRIPWCGGIYLVRGEINQLVVEWPGTSVEFNHSYDDFDNFNRYSCRLELRLFLYPAVQSRHIIKTIRLTRTNGLYIWVLETSTQRWDESLWMSQASVLPFFFVSPKYHFTEPGKSTPMKKQKIHNPED